MTKLDPRYLALPGETPERTMQRAFTQFLYGFGSIGEEWVAAEPEPTPLPSRRRRVYRKTAYDHLLR